jgi:hypothetical protein
VAYFHQDARLLYLAHPRTASNATAHALRRVGFVHCVPGDHHGPVEEMGGDWKRDEWTVFATVRNHWDAVASWMFVKPYPLGPPWSAADVDDFIERCRWIRRGKKLWFYREDTDLVLRYETLQRDLGRVLAGAGLACPTLELENAGKERGSRHYREMFGKDGAARVGDYFAQEIAACGYAY